jgi:hypothetical protein
MAEPNRLRDEVATSVLLGSADASKTAGPPPREKSGHPRRRDRLARWGRLAASTGGVLLLVSLVQSPPSIRLVSLGFGLVATGIGLNLAIRGTEWTLGSISGARRSKWGAVRAILSVPHELLIAEVGWLLLALGLFIIGIAIVMPLLPPSSGG